jgi:putative DNA primase/helicase
MKKETFVFDAVAPFAGTVQVAELLTEIEAVIKKHVVLNPHAAAALAVWVLHTYTFELRDAVAYVAIESPEKRCGKTTLVSVLAAMARKPLIASNITVGALFRAIDTCSPTLFIDEADTFLAGNGTMRGIINSGNTWRTAYVLRLSRAKFIPAQSRPEPGPKSEETGLQRYSCWCPKVIALIGETPDTIADRSIVVKMSRKLVSETCAPLTELDPAEIKAKCARFALDAGPFLARLERIRGEGLNDRAADTFDPLYAIARHAGGDWEKKLHQAALALTATVWRENAGTELLLDMLAIFLGYGREQMLSSDLVETLRSTGGGLRSTALRDSAIDEFQIAKILRPYGVRSSNIRVGSRVNKGYAAVDFREALERYVPMAALDARLEELKRLTKLEREAAAEREKEEEARKAALDELRQKRAMERLPAALDMMARLRAARLKSDPSGPPAGKMAKM